MARSVNRLTDAEILLEAELIMRAVHLRRPIDEAPILLKSRQLSDADEDRVIRAIEAIDRAGVV